MPSGPPRPRNAAATREAILDSAIRSFARAGYDGVGVREIARDAGVTAMLVNRYFGSKELLFAEAVEASFRQPVFIAENPQAIARDAATALVEMIFSRDPQRARLDDRLKIQNCRPVTIAIAFSS